MKQVQDMVQGDKNKELTLLDPFSVLFTLRFTIHDDDKPDK
jgi:hypothetical protein